MNRKSQLAMSVLSLLIAACVCVSTAHAAEWNANELFVVDQGLANVVHLTPPGAALTALSGPTSPADVDAYGLDMIVVDYPAAAPFLFNHDTGAAVQLLADGSAGAVAVDALRHRLYAPVQTGPGMEEVRIYDLASAPPLTFIDSVTSPLSGCAQASVDEDGCLLCPSGSELYRVPVPDTCSTGSGMPELVATAPVLQSAGPAVVRNTTGEIFVLDSGRGCIVKLPAGTCIGGENVLFAPGGLAINQATGMLFTSTVTTDTFEVQIIMQDPSSGNITVLNQGETAGPTAMAVAPPPFCGDGVVDGGEQCDGGSCCTPVCTFAAANTPCVDGDLCNGTDTCDGAGTCNVHSDPETLHCDDGNECTDDSCDPEEDCIHDVLTTNGNACGADNLCDSGRTCQGGFCQGGTMVNCEDNECVAGACNPETGLCEYELVGTNNQAVSGTRATLGLTNRLNDAKNDLSKMVLTGGPIVPFGTNPGNTGDPISAGTSYNVCVVDFFGGEPHKVLYANIPAGGICYPAENRPCWKHVGGSLNPKGAVYHDGQGLFGPVKVAKILGNMRGKSRLVVTLRDTNLLGTNGLPLVQDSMVMSWVWWQNGTSWVAHFDGSTKNNPSRFVAVTTTP